MLTVLSIVEKIGTFLLTTFKLIGKGCMKKKENKQTWAFDNPKAAAISSLSAGDKYFWYKNRFSSSNIWWFVNAVLDFRFFFGWVLEANKFKCDWSAKIIEKNYKKIVFELKGVVHKRHPPENLNSLLLFSLQDFDFNEISEKPANTFLAKEI